MRNKNKNIVPRCDIKKHQTLQIKLCKKFLYCYPLARRRPTSSECRDRCSGVPIPAIRCPPRDPVAAGSWGNRCRFLRARKTSRGPPTTAVASTGPSRLPSPLPRLIAPCRPPIKNISSSVFCVALFCSRKSKNLNCKLRVELFLSKKVKASTSCVLGHKYNREAVCFSLSLTRDRYWSSLLVNDNFVFKRCFVERCVSRVYEYLYTCIRVICPCKYIHTVFSVE